MSAENPHALRKIPLHSSKIRACCTVSRKCLENDVWEQCHLKKQLLTKIIQFLLLRSLPYWKRTNWIVIFRKMGRELILKNNNSFLVRLLRWSHLSDEVFGRHDHQTLSHLTSFFLWGFLKGTVCSNKPASVEVLKHNIQKAVAWTGQQIFLKVANYTQKGGCLSSRRQRTFSAPVIITHCLAHSWYFWKCTNKISVLQYLVALCRPAACLDKPRF